MFGLVGESGSGKTTTGKITAGLLRPTSGKVMIDGVDLYTLERKKLVRSDAKCSSFSKTHYPP